MKDELTEAERLEARRLLGDVVTEVLTRTGVATLVQRAMPNCNCDGRRRALNDFHRRLFGGV